MNYESGYSATFEQRIIIISKPLNLRFVLYATSTLRAWKLLSIFQGKTERLFMEWLRMISVIFRRKTVSSGFWILRSGFTECLNKFSRKICIFSPVTYRGSVIMMLIFETIMIFSFMFDFVQDKASFFIHVWKITFFWNELWNVWWPGYFI